MEFTIKLKPMALSLRDLRNNTPGAEAHAAAATSLLDSLHQARLEELVERGYHEVLVEENLGTYVVERLRRGDFGPSVERSLCFLPVHGHFVFNHRTIQGSVVQDLLDRDLIAYESCVSHEGEDILIYGPTALIQ